MAGVETPSDVVEVTSPAGIPSDWVPDGPDERYTPGPLGTCPECGGSAEQILYVHSDEQPRGRMECEFCPAEQEYVVVD